MDSLPIQCPKCDGRLHEIYYNDQVRRWRCLSCDVRYSSLDWTHREGEIIKAVKRRRERVC